MSHERRGVSGRVGAALVVLAIACEGIAAGAADPYVDERAGVTVDWRRGAVAATGGAAADHRMPSAEVARPGAERRARAAARARLAEALRVLPLGGGRHLDEPSVTRALAQARDVSVDYQSNGGALVRLEIAFGDWTDAEAPGVVGATKAESSVPAADPVAFLVGECHLGAAPVMIVRGKEIVLGGAHYLPAAALPTGTKTVSAHFDKKGRLVPADGESAREFAGRLALVYVRKLVR